MGAGAPPSAYGAQQNGRAHICQGGGRGGMLEGFLCVDTYKLHCYSYIYILYIYAGRGAGGRAGAGRGPGGGR